MDDQTRNGKKRLANWDLLRSLSMFMVVVVHSSGYLPQVSSAFDLPYAVSQVALICDPVFFMLSGYFALRPLKGSLKEYYLKKASSVFLPILIYSIILYLATSLDSLSLGGYLSYASSLFFGGWWFIPALIPLLILSPFLYLAFEGLSDRWILRLSLLIAIVYLWGAAYHALDFAALAIGRPGISNLLKVITAGFPTLLISSYFPVFCYGYLYRRLSTILTKQQKGLIALAFPVSTALCFVLTGIGVGGDDPNHLWVIAAFGLFFLFERVRISGVVAVKAIEWVARRSYSIYLLQYTAIALFSNIFYVRMAFGDIAAFPILIEIGIWLVFVVASYLLSLVGASILDPLVLSNAQRAFNAIAFRKIKSI